MIAPEIGGPATAASASSAGTPRTPSSPVSAVFSQCSASAVSVSSAGEDEAEGGDEEVRMVLEKVNARRVIHAEHGGGMNSLESEAVGGLVVRLERGRLGLKCVATEGL